MAVYETPFWRADGLSGQVGSIDGPVKVAFDNTPRSGSPGVLMGFLEGPQARDYARVGLDERRDAVVGCFARFFGSRALEFVEYFDLAWAAEPWSRGCYAGNLPPGVWTSLGDAIRTPCGPIHWAGTETATVWNGYIDGAISSGERAAAEVLAALGSPAATVV
jgi:monoamine oxidase